MKERFDQIIAAGWPAIQQIVDDETEETLHLEFKTLVKVDGTLVKGDRGIVSKALSGFANAEGGLLIIGIYTDGKTGLDSASEIRKIANARKLASIIRADLSDLISRAPPGIGVEPITEDDGDPSGVVCVFIPPSQLRPHMSVREQRYFRRGSKGTGVMFDGEVRDMMFAERAGQVSVEFEPTITSVAELNNPHNSFFNVRFNFYVKNSGLVSVRAPYMHITGSEKITVTLQGNEGQKNRSNGGVGVSCLDANCVLHPKQLLLMATCWFNCFVEPDLKVTAAENLSRKLRFEDYQKIRYFVSDRPSDEQVIPQFEIEVGALSTLTSKQSYPFTHESLTQLLFPMAIDMLRKV